MIRGGGFGTGISDLSAYFYSRGFAAFRSNEVLAQPEILQSNSPSETLAELADPRCNLEALYPAKWIWGISNTRNEMVGGVGQMSEHLLQIPPPPAVLNSAAVFKQVALTGLLGLGKSFSVAEYELSRNGDRVWEALTAGENDLGIKWLASEAFSRIDTK